MKILITGALGHIGSKLIREIPKKIDTAEIHILDSFYTQRYSSLFNLKKEYNYTFYECDILVDKKKVSSIIKQVDVVIHLAALTDAASSVNKPDVVEKNNLECTKVISKFCSLYKKKLVFISSTSVYGTQEKKVDENCLINDLQPQSPYALTKLKEEKIIKSLIKKKKLKATLLRFGTIYGVSQGMRFHTAVNKFCFQAAVGQDITVWKTAYNQKRPYLDLNDAIRAIAFIIKKNIFTGETYNILTENLTVRQVIEAIKVNIRSIKIKYIDSKIMNQLSYEVLNDKFINEGFIFKGNYKIGIKNTIKLIKSLS